MSEALGTMAHHGRSFAFASRMLSSADRERVAGAYAYAGVKNVLALRTLFAVAHRLSLLLSESWLLVLGTVNCLDCILNTPRQSVQV